MSPGGRDKFAMDVTHVDRARLLRLSGEFDLAAVETFERRLSANRDPVAKTTVIDLGDVRFMDSSGLRALIKAELDLRAAGGRVVVVRSSGQVADLLKLTGVAGRLEMADEIPSDLGASDGA